MNELPPDNHTVARKRLDYLEKQLTKRMVLKKTDEWYIEWQRMTARGPIELIAGLEKQEPKKKCVLRQFFLLVIHTILT